MNERSSDNPIYVIGTDAGGLANLSSKLGNLILSSKRIVGPKRLLEDFNLWWESKGGGDHKPEIFKTESPKAIVDCLKEKENTTVVLASGDPLWFGIGRQLLENFPKERLIFHPSPSSLQLAFSRLGRPWQDVKWISLHGRDPSPLVEEIEKEPKVLALLPDPNRGGAKEIRRILISLGLENFFSFWIFEQLGSPKEKIQLLLPKDKLDKDLDPLHLVVLIKNQNTIELPKNLPLFGIDDHIFIQYSDRPGLMTKKEIRVQILASLELPEEGVLWDLGAGVGSIGLEAIRIRPNLQLMAADKRSGSKNLIHQNAERLNVNVTAIFEEEAKSLIDHSKIPANLANPDRVIIGGGGANKIEIIQIAIKSLQINGIIVIPLAQLEEIGLIKKALSSKCKVSISQHHSSRGVAISNGTRLVPINPIIIVKGIKYKD